MGNPDDVPLLCPSTWDYLRQILHRHPPPLPSLKDRLLNIGRQQRQPEQRLTKLRVPPSASAISAADL